MTFRSTGVTPQSTGNFDLRGDLTIKGTTKPVVVQVHPTGALQWEGTAPVNRKDFGITHDAFSDRAIGDKIDITLKISAVPGLPN